MRLLVVVALVVAGMAQGVRAQEAGDEKPCAARPAPPPETTVTVYLKNVSQQQDANDLQTAVRNMVSRAKVFYNQSANAIMLRGTADDLAMAQKVIADLDLPKKAYRLEYTVRLMDGAKATATQHYSLMVVWGERAELKLGNKVPLMTGSRMPDAGAASSQVQYLDVGLNITATLTGSGDVLILRTKVEQSTLADEKSAGGRSKDGEGRFANAHKRLARVEGPVAVNPDGAEGCQAPEDGAGHNERLAAVPVAEPAGERRGNHIENEHRRGQRAHLLVGGVEFTLDEGLCAGQNVSVNEIEQVKADEQQKCNQSGREARAERWVLSGQEFVILPSSVRRYNEYHSEPGQAHCRSFRLTPSAADIWLQPWCLCRRGGGTRRERPPRPGCRP